MWVFTRDGFFSVVQDRAYADLVWIRARVRKDIEAMQALIKSLNGRAPKIQETLDRDYRFRFPVGKKVWATVMEAEANSIDYPNFKGSIHGDDPIRDRLMMDVWARLVRYQEDQAGRTEIRKGKR